MLNQNLSDSKEIELLFHSQSEEIKSFLVRSSILTELHPSAINQYLNISNSREILEKLFTDNQIVYKDKDNFYHYPQELREFFYSKLTKKMKYSKNINKEHLKLANIYKEMCLYLPAFVHYVAGKDYFQATRMIRITESRYNPVDFLTLLTRCLESGNANLFSRDFDVFLIRCIPLSILEQLIPTMESDINKYKKHNQLSLVAHSKYRLATIYIYKGEINEAKQIYLDSLKISTQINLHDKMILNHLGIAETLIFSGNYDEAIYYVKRALFYSEKFQYHYYQTYSLWLLSAIYLEKNNFDKAEPFLKQAIKLREESDEDDTGKTFSYCSMSKYLRYKQDYVQSTKWAEKALRHALHYGNDLDVGEAYVELSKNYMAMEQWEQAESYLDNAYSVYKHFSYHRCIVLYQQLKISLKKGDTLAAKAKHKRLLEISKKNNYRLFIEKLNDSKPKLIVNQANVTPILRLEVLGRFKLLLNGKPVSLTRSSSLQLLQILITYRNQNLNKDFLLDLLFPDHSLDSINKNFYVALSTLRKALEPDLKSGRMSTYITQSKNHYMFNSKSLYLDAEEFNRLINEKTVSLASRTKNLLKAESLYRGDYFEEYPYEVFLEEEREKLRAQYLDVLKQLAYIYWNPNNYKLGIEYFEKLLAFDPYQDIVYLEYIERLLKSNLFLQAKSVAERYIKYIENELGFSVQNKLQSLFERYSFAL